MDSTTAPTRYQLFKDLPPAIESALRASIYRFGVLMPVAKDQHGNILDGHQRARLADELGIKYPVNIIEVADEAEALEIVRTLNEDRREMPRAQRLPVVKDLREAGYMLADIAEVVGTSAEQVRQDLSTFKDLKVPEKACGKDGKWRPTTYQRKEPRPPEADTLRLAAEVNRQRRDERRERHIEQGRTSVPAPSVDAPTFRVVYADPPWKYSQSGLVDWGMAEDHYPTMPLDDLKALPVAAMTMPDSVLFLWATSPMLADALDLMAAWGFTYKSSIVWDKGRSFLGSYVHISHELLLVGTRGSCVADVKHTAGSVFRVPSGKHSAKPEEFRALIDSLYTFGNRIELFRRGDAPDGWHVWGNEVRDG